MSVSMKNMPERVERDKPVSTIITQETPKKESAPTKPPVKRPKPTTVSVPAKKKKKLTATPASNVKPPIKVSVRIIADDHTHCMADKLPVKDYKLFLDDIREVLTKHAVPPAKSKKTK